MLLFCYIISAKINESYNLCMSHMSTCIVFNIFCHILTLCHILLQYIYFTPPSCETLKSYDGFHLSRSQYVVFLWTLSLQYQQHLIFSLSFHLIDFIVSCSCCHFSMLIYNSFVLHYRICCALNNCIAVHPHTMCSLC